MKKFKFKKNGELTKKSKEEAKAFIKNEFEKIENPFVDLPREMVGYYKKVQGGKNRAKQAYKNPETGKFLTKKEAQVINDAVEKFAINKGYEVNYIKANKDLIKIVYDAEIKKEFSNLIPSSVIGDMVKQPQIKKVFLRDQYDNIRQVTPEEAILKLTEANRIVQEATGGKTFASKSKVTLKDLKTTLEIFVPNLRKDGKKLESGGGSSGGSGFYEDEDDEGGESSFFDDNDDPFDTSQLDEEEIMDFEDISDLLDDISGDDYDVNYREGK